MFPHRTTQSAQGYYQYVVQRVLLAADPPWVVQTLKHIPHFPHHPFLHPIAALLLPILGSPLLF